MKFILVVVFSTIAAIGAGWLTMANNVIRMDEKLDVSKTAPLGEGKVKGVKKFDLEKNKGETPARIEVTNGLEHDFGTMRKDETKSHGFMFTNSGGSPAIIKLMQTSCKCTLSDELGKETILKPGESKEIELSWTPKNWSKDFEQSATIQTQDPDVRVITLKISGVVIQNVRPDPDVMFAPAVSAKEDTQFRAMNVYGYRKDDFKILEMSWSDPATSKHFEISSRPLTAEEIAAEKGAKTGESITITAKAGMPYGRIQQTLNLKTNEEGADALIKVPVLVQVKSDVRISSLDENHSFISGRNLLDMGVVSTEPQTTKLTLFATVPGENGEPVEMRVLEDETKPRNGIIAKFSEPSKIGKATRYQLEITIPVDQPAVSLQGRISENETGKIVIESNVETAKRIEIFVKYAVVK